MLGKLVRKSSVVLLEAMVILFIVFSTLYIANILEDILHGF